MNARKAAENGAASRPATETNVADEVAGGADPGGPAATRSTRPRKPGRGRRITAVTLVILAAIVSVVMMVSVWAHGFLLDTNTFVTTVAPVLDDPQVTQRMGEVVAQRTIELTNAEQRLTDVLPPSLQFIAAPIVGQVEQQLAQSTTKLLRSERGYAAWQSILRFTHRSVVAVLRDESAYINIHGDQVRLDLLPLVVAAVNRLNDLLPAVIETRLPLPEFDPRQTPEEQRAELARALARPVSPDFAQVTLFRGGQVQTAQRALRLFDLLVYVLIGLTAILVLAAVVVSPRRLRTLVHLGIAAAVAVIITRVAISQVQDAVLGAAAQTRALPVIRAGVTAVFDSLQDLIVWGLVAGAVTGVLAYLAGRPRWLIRGAARFAAWARVAKAWGKAAGAQAAQHRDPAQEWTRTHRDGLLVGITVLAVALLLFFAGSLGGAIAIIVVAGVLAGGVYWIGRTPLGDGPAAPVTGEPARPTGGRNDPPDNDPPDNDPPDAQSDQRTAETSPDRPSKGKGAAT